MKASTGVLIGTQQRNEASRQSLKPLGMIIDMGPHIEAVYNDGTDVQQEDWFQYVGGETVQVARQHHGRATK